MEKPASIPNRALFQRPSWRPLPAIAALSGEAAFIRKEIERRFIRELFGDEPLPSIQRFDASRSVDGMLARVLDELRTLSILSSSRLVIVEPAEPFLAAFRDDLLPFIASGFEGGHLILHIDKALDERTRFAKALIAGGWNILCPQPFDRPPPWKTADPPWKNPLSEWIAERGALRGLTLDLKTAYVLQERVGNDLGVLDGCLEKISIHLGKDGGKGKKTVTRDAITAVTGEIREDSIFDLAQACIAGERTRALKVADRLIQNGYHPPHGNPIFEASTIAILFIGAMVAKLKPLRRAHALSGGGGGPDRWIELRLTSRPFIERFRKELAAMPPRRIERAFQSLLEMDRAIKSGHHAHTALTLFLASA